MFHLFLSFFLSFFEKLFLAAMVRVQGRVLLGVAGAGAGAVPEQFVVRTVLLPDQAFFFFFFSFFKLVNRNPFFVPIGH